MGPAFPACIHGQSRAVSLVPRSTPVRPAAVAGSFYPGDPTRRHGGGRAPSMTTLMSVVKSFGPTVFMNFGPGRKRLQIASGASGVAESCGLGQACLLY